MLSRSSPMPNRAGYAYEPKLDGFRCLIRTEGTFEARSRRFWNMTPHLPELDAIPARGIFDGDGAPPPQSRTATPSGRSSSATSSRA
jgi:ATP-dependent DNA ligase